MTHERSKPESLAAVALAAAADGASFRVGYHAGSSRGSGRERYVVTFEQASKELLDELRDLAARTAGAEYDYAAHRGLTFSAPIEIR